MKNFWGDVDCVEDQTLGWKTCSSLFGNMNISWLEFYRRA